MKRILVKVNWEFNRLPAKGEFIDIKKFLVIEQKSLPEKDSYEHPKFINVFIENTLERNAPIPYEEANLSNLAREELNFVEDLKKKDVTQIYTVSEDVLYDIGENNECIYVITLKKRDEKKGDAVAS